MRILVALDFSECSSLACQWALARAVGLGVEELVFHHVLDEMQSPQEELGLLEKATRDVIRFVDTLREGAALEGVELRYSVTRGKPADELVAAALSHRADAVVMGTHGRTGLDRFLLGSVAESVVRRAPCTVIVVKPEPGA